jgi:hypothetical protein
MEVVDTLLMEQFRLIQVVYLAILLLLMVQVLHYYLILELPLLVCQDLG